MPIICSGFKYSHQYLDLCPRGPILWLWSLLLEGSLGTPSYTVHGLVNKRRISFKVSEFDPQSHDCIHYSSQKESTVILNKQFYNCEENWCTYFPKKPRNHLRILGARCMTWSKSYYEWQEILDATIQNLFMWVTWQPGFVQTWWRI